MTPKFFIVPVLGIALWVGLAAATITRLNSMSKSVQTHTQQSRPTAAPVATAMK